MATAEMDYVNRGGGAKYDVQTIPSGGHTVTFAFEPDVVLIKCDRADANDWTWTWISSDNPIWQAGQTQNPTTTIYTIRSNTYTEYITQNSGNKKSFTFGGSTDWAAAKAVALKFS